MKFLVVFACALAAASAGLVAPIATVYGAQHLPLIGANGVPVDTAEVQIARAQHLAHKVEAHARNGDYALAAPVVSAYSAPLVSAYSAPVVAAYGAQAYGLHAYAPAAYPTTAVLPASVNGVPLETPEVVAAKSNHFAAHAEALARNVHAVHYRKRRGIVAAPLAYSSSLAYSSPLAYSASLAYSGSYAYNYAAPAYSAAYASPYNYLY